MSGGEKMPLAVARRAAEEFIDTIGSACVRAEIAGSIRRGAEQVGDIEIVCIPRTRPTGQLDLMGSKVGTNNELEMRMETMKATGLINTDRQSKNGRASPFGPRYYRVNYIGHTEKTRGVFPVDLFLVLPPASWGTTFMVRTGCAEFSHWLVEHRKRDGYVFKDGHLEHVLTGVIATPEEEDVFRALGMKYIPPEKRIVDTWGNRVWEKLQK